jgi:hypothetical protein
LKIQDRPHLPDARPLKKYPTRFHFKKENRHVG